MRGPRIVASLAVSVLIAASVSLAAGGAASAAPRNCVTDSPAAMKKHAAAYYDNVNKGRWKALKKLLSSEHGQQVIAGLPGDGHDDTVAVWQLMKTVFPDMRFDTKTLTADPKTTSSIPGHRRGSVAAYGDIIATVPDGSVETIEFSNTLFFDKCNRLIDEEWVIATPPSVISAIEAYLSSQNQ